MIGKGFTSGEYVSAHGLRVEDFTSGPRFFVFCLMQRKRVVEEVLSLSIQTLKMSMARAFSFIFSLIQSVSIIFSLFLVYVLLFKNSLF